MHSFPSGIVTPLFKKGAKTLPLNFRPVALTQMIGNIEEKIIIKHIVEHVTKQNLWDKDQFGFMRKRNTTTAAIKLIQKIAASTKKEKHSGVAILSLDVRKAFDSLSHNMIMRKILKRYNIAGSVANFNHDFLTNRHMVVRVAG